MKVFVYGTLKKGRGNHHLLSQSKFLGTAETLPQYTMVSLGAFPGVIENGITQIQGEIYEVNAEQLVRLDRLEGHPNFYRRDEIETSEGKAWIYLLPPEYLQHTRIASGEW